MTGLTGFFGTDWLLMALILFGAAVVAMSRRSDVAGYRIRGFLLVPSLAGAALVVLVGIRFGSDVRRFAPFLRRPVTAVLVLAVAFTVGAVADVLFARFVGLPGRILARTRRDRAGDIGLAVFIGGAAILGFAGMVAMKAGTTGGPSVNQSTTLKVEAIHRLPSSPLGIALRSDRDGYLSLGDRVAHFELADDLKGRLSLTTVATGFTYTRGLTIAGDVLVVADLGPLPCPDPFPACHGEDIPGFDRNEGEQRILEESRARLVAYDLASDGSLTNQRVIVDELPVANSEHGVNGLVTGPDGYIYVAIGHIDHLPISMAEAVEHPKIGLLGTILRVSPNGKDVQVFARGLRNIYGLTFDDRGGLWGVDNDGETIGGWRAEEVLNIQPGHNYGYPYEGSFGRHEIRDDDAVWFAEGAGSAGILWATHVGLGPGLLIGSCGRLDSLGLTDHEGRWGVQVPTDYRQLLPIQGCVTDIEPIGRGYLLVSSLGRMDALYILSTGGSED
ncbi:MAG: PQQ-dependent sugar dehydrogenase [Actinomycetota bacterium]